MAVKLGRTVGIDLGTTNSVVSVRNGNEKEVIINAEGSRTTPSIVAFSKNGEILVGELAKRQAVTNVDRTIRSVKRHMGTDWSIKIDNKKFTPQQISAFILQKLKKDAEKYLNSQVTDAVITVPAYFNDSQRQATKEAGEIAGLNVLRIINEPTAAALAYGLDKPSKDQTVLVFDLGGGTFDVSLLDIGSDVVEVRATSGDNHLGGDDWDNALVDYVVDKFKKSNGVDLAKDKIAYQRIYEACEKVKIELSSKEESDITLPYITVDKEKNNSPLHIEEKITRALFQKTTEHLLKRCKKPLDDVLKDAKVSMNEVSQIILVGGSTRMPAVVDFIQEVTKKEPIKNVNPDEVVAIGAAVQAGIIKGDVTDLLLLDVTPLSLGIETQGGIMTVLIARNTTIPAKKTEVFTTAEDNQPAVQIQVYQGERKIARDNKKLGMFELSGIAPAPRGIPQIEVTFDIDANGIMHVGAKDRGTGKEQSMTVSGGSALSQDEIDKMKKEAEEYAEEDAKKTEAITIKNSAEQTVYSTEKFISDNKDKVDSDSVEKVNKLLEELKSEINAGNTDSIKSKNDEVNKFLQEIGTKMYQQASSTTPPTGDSTTNKDSNSNNKDEGVVEAEVVDDDKK